MFILRLHLEPAHVIVAFLLLFTGAGCQSDSKPGPDLDADGVSSRRDCDDLDPTIGRPPEGCAPGQACRFNTDCVSGVCGEGMAGVLITNSGQCLPPSCEDEVQNGDETDVDCGGECPIACQGEQSCLVDADCASDRCVDSRCGAPCENPSFAGSDCDRCSNPIFDGPNCDDCVDRRFTGPLCLDCADPKFTGNNCEFCSNDRFTGANCDECISRFTGENCAECADPRWTGVECDSCAEGFEGTRCDQCSNPRATGELCEGCVEGFTGDDCTECADPRFAGAECDECSERFTGPDCSECVDAHYTGALCDQCAPPYGGEDCRGCADPRYTGEQCDECADERFQGRECDECADPRRRGPQCEQCGPRFQGPNCGECRDIYVGANCEHYAFAGITGGGGTTCGYYESGSYVCWGGLAQRIRFPRGIRGDTLKFNDGLGCALNNEGRAVCFGTSNANGQHEPPEDVEFTTLSVGRREPAFDVDPSGHACGIDTEGTAHCWGRSDRGQATVPEGLNLVAIDAGVSFTAGIDTEGQLHSWGTGGRFNVTRTVEMYHGRRTAADTIRFPQNITLASIAVGWYHTCGITSAGNLVCGGDSYFGQARPPAGTYVKVVSGFAHSCALSTEGAITCWGDCTSNIRNLSCVPEPGVFTDLSGGKMYACGLREDGVTVCWGEPATPVARPN